MTVRELGVQYVRVTGLTRQGCGLLLDFQHGHEHPAGAKQQRVLLQTGPLATALTPLVARRDGLRLRQALLQWLLPGMQQRLLPPDAHGPGKRRSKSASHNSGPVPGPVMEVKPSAGRTESRAFVR